MKSSDPKISWGVEQRLEFIEFKLFWDGRLKRSDITDHFEVSVPQASSDLALYKDRAPNNIRYDASAKRYLPSEDFFPVFYKPNAERYLAQLRAITDRVIERSDTFFGELPDVGMVPIPFRRLEPMVLRKFLTAIRQASSIKILYQSLNDERPDPTWREISPHAFGSDGLRWHVRAYCHVEHKFKDFIISRCLEVGEFGQAAASAADDTAWNEVFTVVLKPNPKLSAAQQTTIEHDYGMIDGKCDLRVRIALLYYLDKRLRLDIADVKDRPKETPVVVENRAEYEKVRDSVAY